MNICHGEIDFYLGHTFLGLFQESQSSTLFTVSTHPILFLIICESFENDSRAKLNLLCYRQVVSLYETYCMENTTTVSPGLSCFKTRNSVDNAKSKEM